MPTISPEDVTVLAACNVLCALDGTVSDTSHDAVALRTVIRNLHAIVSPAVPDNAAALRMGVAPSPRVPSAARDARVLRPTISNDAAPPVLYPRIATTSLDTTSRTRVRGMRFVHQQTTRNNNPFAPLETMTTMSPMLPPMRTTPIAPPTTQQFTPTTVLRARAHNELVASPPHTRAHRPPPAPCGRLSRHEFFALVANSFYPHSASRCLPQ